MGEAAASFLLTKPPTCVRDDGWPSAGCTQNRHVSGDPAESTNEHAVFSGRGHAGVLCIAMVNNEEDIRPAAVVPPE